MDIFTLILSFTLEKYKNLLMLSNSRILITGANGFVGHHVCAAILKADAKLTQLVRANVPSRKTKNAQIVVDLTNRHRVAEIFSALQPD